MPEVLPGQFADLMATATEREAVKTADSKSGAQFERVVIEGDRYLVKYLGDDWLASASLDTNARAAGLWEAGIYALFADDVDSAVVCAGRFVDNSVGLRAALLMRDVTDSLVPVDGGVGMDTHAAFIDAMAAMHARCWLRVPAGDLMPFGRSYSFLTPTQAKLERDELGDRSPVLHAVVAGWQALATADPELMDLIGPVLDDCSPLVDGLATTPQTFVHGDWKMGNLGRHDDGRVVLLDWDRAASGAGAADLAWYLAVNCDRLPESKADSCERYRESLSSRGIDTSEWWSRQLSLALLGGFLQLGWGKVDQADELAWWRERAVEGLAQLRVLA